MSRSTDDTTPQPGARAGLPSCVLVAALGAFAVSCSGEVTPPGGSAVGDVCGDSPFASTEAPVRRLTEVEYHNTVRDLFPGADLPEVELVASGRVNAFTNHAGGASVSPLAVERYAEGAATIAGAAVQQLDGWAPCAPSGPSDADCAAQIARVTASRAYRRPLEAEEQAQVEGFARSAVEEHGFEAALEMVLTGLLESPFFLYRPEFGSGAEGEGGAVALSDYELASRLSYLFWQTMPDQELMDAAAAGRLQTDEGLAEQAQRMIRDERARPVLRQFLWDWLGLYQLESLDLDAEAFPSFDAELRADLIASAERYLDKALWEDDSYESLLLGDYGYVNDRLAPLFGVPAPGSEELMLTQLDASQRRGVLTQPSWLAATSHGISHSPIFRGVKILDRLLCSPPPPPPPEVLDSVGMSDGSRADICTTRDHVALTHSAEPSCQGCHASIDGTGFAFENYDGLGRWRTEENGCEVNARGDLALSDVDGRVANGVEAAERLSQSGEVAECFSTQWFRFALGRTERDQDRCQVRAIAELLQDSDGSLQGMMLALVSSPAFRTRPPLSR